MVPITKMQLVNAKAKKEENKEKSFKRAFFMDLHLWKKADLLFPEYEKDLIEEEW